MAPSHIAIVGGGLTGLSSAWHLSRRFPHTRITLLEKQPRFGGWVHSERVEVDDGRGNRESMVLEAGPRTLRPRSKAILELIHLLNLRDSIITVPLTSPAAKSRFLRLPGHPGLAQIPSSLSSLLSSPLTNTLVSAVLREPLRAPNRPAGTTDESFDSLLSRRFGAEFARIFGSALVHGVYAADSRKLSSRAAFPVIWDAEERGRGSIVKGFMRRSKPPDEAQHDLGDMEEKMKGVSVYSFKDGMSTLVDALLKDLKTRPNVRLLSDTPITSLTPKSDTVELTTPSTTLHPTHLVCALPLPHLHTLLPASHPLPHLTANPSSSVTVVNLIFPPSPTPLHPPGFGYLIPRPTTDDNTNHDGILGTVFDSCSVSAQDTPLSPSPSPTTQTRFTKLTVMLGGAARPVTPVPAILAAHLGLPAPLPHPVLARVHRNKDCIPTPTVGHLERMAVLRGVLRGAPWGGRVQVVGAGVTGVSVGDCVEAGRNAGRDW